MDTVNLIPIGIPIGKQIQSVKVTVELWIYALYANTYSIKLNLIKLNNLA